MNDDHRTEQRPRVRPRPADDSAAARRALRAAQGAPIKKTAPGGAQPRPKRPAAQNAQRRRAEALYPDDAYYQKRRSPGGTAKKSKKGRRKKRNSWGRAAVFSAVAVVAALLVAFLVHTFLFQVIRVSSDAMYDTLLDGDLVCITKYDYWTHAPERGDIVAVAVSGSGGGVVLRRVVGLPGEELAIDGNGDTLINGDPLGERYVTLKSYDQYPAVVLPGGRYFVLSDNRTVKMDSRDSSIDMVSKQSIIGKVRAILYPFDRSGTLD